MKQAKHNNKPKWAELNKVDKLWCIQVDGLAAKPFTTKKEAVSFARAKGAFIRR
jgi:hypothetical protein